MNLEFADQALDSNFMNFDMDWMQHFYACQTKPASDSSRWTNTINDDLEIELLHIINAANKRSRTIAAPAINTGAMSSWDLAAVTMGHWKPELDIRRNAPLPLNSFDTTPVPLSSCSLITKNVPPALNTSVLHKYPSAFRSEPPPPPPPQQAAPEVAGGLCRGASAPVKVKKKRVRPSRRVPTTVVKTDTSNFKAMVQHFTGLPTTTSGTQESTQPPTASSSSPESTSSATSPASFSKPLPHPVLCKISNSSVANPRTTASTAVTLLPTSIPTCESLPELPAFISTEANVTDSDQISGSDYLEEHTEIPLIDVSFFEKLWNEINFQPMGTNL